MTPVRRSWTLRATLLAITIVPPLIMLLLVATALYFFRINEIREDIDERGRLVAAAVAEASRFGVASGNAVSLEATLQGLLTSDESIAAIDILGLDRRPLITVRTKAATRDAALVFERPIRAERPVVNVYESIVALNVLPPQTAASSADAGRVLAFVRVAMSPTPLLEAKSRSLYLTGALLAVAGGFGLGAGLLLVERLRRPITDVLSALRDFREGRYAVPDWPRAPGELGQLQMTLAEAARALATTTRDLEAQVAIRTEMLEKANEERRELIARSNTQLEDERRRIAGDIHDGMNAALVALRFDVTAIGEVAGHSSDEASRREISRLVVQLTEKTNDIYVAARGIIKQLRPEVIDTLGLEGALAEMVRNYDQQHPACRFWLRIDEAFPRLSEQLAITAYRLVQEALSNVVKHARATSASVWLGGQETPAAARIIITDDGAGFDVTAPRTGSLGLVGMRERVQAVGGSIEIHSEQGEGTTLRFVLPLPKS